MRNLPRAVIIMIVFLVLLGVGIWLVLAARQSGPQSGPPPSASNPQAAAEQALETFRQIVTSENYEALGFQTPDEVKIAKLGEPLKVLRVPLDQLLSFSPDRNHEEQPSLVPSHRHARFRLRLASIR